MTSDRWICWFAPWLLAACAAPGVPLGPAGAPIAAEVLGHPVRARSAEEMQHFILLELTDRYAVDHGIVVAQAEVDAHVARQREVLATDPNVKSMPDSAADRTARSQAARAYLLQRKIDASLQRRYGGRIAARSGGAVPVEAYRRFLEDQAAQGRFRILDPDYAAVFWRTWTDETRWHFLDEGSDAAASAFELPAQPGRAP